jgi:hypothetical protein
MDPDPIAFETYVWIRIRKKILSGSGQLRIRNEFEIKISSLTTIGDENELKNAT